MNSKKLSEIVDLQKGKKPEISSTSNGNLPYLTAKYIRGEADPEYGIPNSNGSLVVSPKDFVIIMDGSNSGEVFTGLNGILASTMGKLVLKEQINLKYLGYFLDSNKELFAKTKTGSAIPHLSKEIFFSLQIPMPSLKDQEKIVDRLDKAFKNISTQIEKCNLNLELIAIFFNENLDKYFSKEFTNTKKFSELIKKVENKKWSHEKNDNHKYIEISSVSNTEFKINSYSDINNIDPPSRAKKIVLENDVLLATTRPTLKRVAIVPKELNNQIASTGFFVFRLLNKVDKHFLFYYLISNKFKKIMKNTQKGASYPAVNETDIKNMHFNYPEINDQLKFVNRITEIDNICNSLQKIIHKKVTILQELRLSILSKELSHE
jgi:type I restriction enzyme S subunit